MIAAATLRGRLRTCVLSCVVVPLLLGGCGGDPRARELCEAISRSDVRDVEQVLAGGAIDPLKDAGGCVPAREGFLKADSDDGARIAQALLDNGLDANAVVLLAGRHRGPNASSVRGLVELAAGHERPALIQALTARGLDIKGRNAGLAVLRAAEAGHIGVVRALVEAGAGINEPLGESTALGRAIRLRRHAVIAYLDERGARESEQEGVTLFRAARKGDVPAIDHALAKGALVDSLDVENETALVRAAAFGQTQALEALLAAGADINCMPVEGMSALHVAVAEGHLPVARALLAKGARVDLRFDAYSVTPLMLAQRRRDLAMIAALIEAGADATRLDAGGDSPFR